MKSDRPNNSDGLTNDIILQLIKAYCHGRISLPPDQTFNKAQLLSTLYSQTNATEVFRCGYSIKEIQENPILDALHQADDPQEFIRRWTVLETYSHTRNRTRIIDLNDEHNTYIMTIEHYSMDGEDIHWLSHCFVWGMLQGIIESCLFSAGLFYKPQDKEYLDLGLDEDQSKIDWPGEANAHRVDIRWNIKDNETQLNINSVRKDELLDFLSATIASDPMKQWKVKQLAELSAYSVRSFQRFLKEQGLTFSKLLIKTRLQVAVELMNKTHMNISEVAFCAGFSDHAHFTRRFKEFYGSPPSAYLRTILQH